MAEVSSINVKSIVDTAVTQFKTAIQEVLTSEVARVQGLLGAAQREEAAIRERFASGEAQITERTAIWPHSRRPFAGAKSTWRSSRAPLQGSKPKDRRPSGLTRLRRPPITRWPRSGPAEE